MNGALGLSLLRLVRRKIYVAMQQSDVHIPIERSAEATGGAQGSEIRMTNTPFEVPVDLRDFAQKSVEQARKAFEGFVNVAQKTADAVDTASANVRANVKSVSTQSLGYAEQNINAAFDLRPEARPGQGPAGGVHAAERIPEEPDRQAADAGQGDRRARSRAA